MFELKRSSKLKGAKLVNLGVRLSNNLPPGMKGQFDSEMILNIFLSLEGK